jgi:hypothetical protein
VIVQTSNLLSSWIMSCSPSLLIQLPHESYSLQVRKFLIHLPHESYPSFPRKKIS